jgi:hypothetical protein
MLVILDHEQRNLMAKALFWRGEKGKKKNEI